MQTHLHILLNFSKASQQKYVQVGDKRKMSQKSEAAKLITKMIMLHHIFLINKKKHFLQMIYISRYKKKWSFSQTKVKVDNNPKSRFFLLGHEVHLQNIF